MMTYSLSVFPAQSPLTSCVAEGLKKLAAYRDESGTLHLHSASCAHICTAIVSRPVGIATVTAGVDSNPLNAPAISGLQKIEALAPRLV
jgi:hypothetical protein